MTPKISSVLLDMSSLTAACRKTKEAPPICPNGYWRGFMYIYNIAIINAGSGKSRLYLAVPRTDAANAGRICDGKFTMLGNVFRAEYPFNNDTLVFESVEIRQDLIRGLVISGSGAALQFELRKN